MENLKHLFDGRAFAIPGVDPSEYELLAHEIYNQFAPEGPVECFHVDMLIYNVWTYCRLLHFQEDFHSAAAKPAIKAALDYAALRLPAMEQCYSRTIKDLRALQRKRESQPADTPQMRGVGFVLAPGPNVSTPALSPEEDCGQRMDSLTPRVRYVRYEWWGGPPGPGVPSGESSSACRNGAGD